MGLFAAPERSHATHISGADLTYRWVSGNTFEITLTLYRDCSGIAAPNSVTVNYKSFSCGINNNVTINKIAGTGMEITHPCSTATTTCSGGTNPGIQKYVYVGNVTLPSQCTDWVFSYSVCCRNCAISTLTYAPNNCSGVPATYVEATLNNLTDPTNSSPSFTNAPLSFLCIGQSFHYNHGAYDADGDSIVYSLIPPRSAENTDVVFKAGYSATSPITSSPALTIDPSTGDLVMNPTANEVAVMAILVKEYRNGVLVGTVVRDMEVWTQACTNMLPTVSGINGSANYEVTACPGVPLSFTISSADPDAGQTLTMSWNSGIPNGTFTMTAGARPTGTFTWTPTAADQRPQPYSFTVTIEDDGCPIKAYQTYSFTIHVPVFSISLTGNNSNCAVPPSGSASATPTGTGPFQYAWSPGAATTSAISNLTGGTYSVIVTDGNGCTLNSSVAITSPPPLTATISAVTNVTCNGMNNGTISISAGGGTGPYTYSWSPSGATSATISSLSPGTYTVTVTDSKGCTKTASTTITQPAALTATTSGSVLSCYGQTNGTVSVNAAGGTTPYNYLWSNGSTTSSLTSLAAGNYSVTVTDARGCTISKTAAVTGPAQLNLSISTSPAYCNQANGGASVIVTGGNPGYTYSWFPGNYNSASVSNIYAGNYTVTVTDNNGCTATSSVGVPGIAGPVVNVTSLSNVTCSGLTNGSATVSLTGGTSPFIYSWSPAGGNALTASGLPAGTYIFSATDANNCVSTLPVTISEPAVLQISSSQSDPACSGSGNGSISVTATGGTAPYNYNWSGGLPNNSTVSNLSPGNYSLTVTDQHGCSDSLQVTLTQPAPLTGSITSVTNVSCHGGNNGAAGISASGGTTPYSYLWSPGGFTTSSASGLTAGSYTVRITDAHNCTADVSISISEPAQLTSVFDSISALRCNGDNSGYIHAGAIGGTSPYSYSWSPGGQTSNSISGLAAGNYSITVTDNNGCTTTASTAVIQPAILNASVSTISNVSCFGGNDGAAAINVAGGVMPYSYQWNPGAIVTASSVTLTANNYTTVVTDANGCVDTVSFQVSEPSALSATTSVTDALCNSGSDGGASVSATGGTTPYYYLWNNGSTSSALTAITAGTYNVQITDIKGCTFNATATVGEPAAMNVSVTIVNANCGKPNGSATTAVSGGTAPYTYLWNTNSPQPSISNKVAGVYYVVVEDAHGCADTADATIINIAGPSVSLVSTANVTCPGGNDGNAQISAAGGVLPYTYSWTNSTSVTATANSLAAGSYVVTVKDKKNCIGTLQVDITEPPAFNINVTNTGVSCNGGNDGQASVTATGGTGTLSYLWSNGVNTTTTGSLTASAYNVTVTDQNGCTSSATANIVQPVALSSGMSLTVPVSCNGYNDATAQIYASGGTPPYNYLWNESNDTTYQRSGLMAGNYTSTVTDSKGCTSTAGLIITEPATLVAQVSSTWGTCNVANGTASALVTGGSAPYNYQWQSGETTASISGLAPGTFNVTATDINGCTAAATAIVQNTGMLSLSLFSTMPVSCYGGSDGQAVVTATNGSEPYTYNWSSGGTTSHETGLAAGNYTVTVNDTNNCTQTLPVTISQPTAVSATISVTHVTCAGSANGSAVVTATGGTGAFTYNWQPGGSAGMSASSLSGGTYSVTVTDAKGCSTSDTVIVSEPSPLTVSTSTTLAGCLLSNGSASAVAAGGTPPYQYQWTPGQSNTSTLSAIPAGSYMVTVTDNNSCTVATQASVSNTVSPSVSVLYTKHVSCFSGSDGEAEITVQNGTGPFTYNWFPSGGNTTKAINLNSGTYSFTVRDSNNCFQAIDVVIDQPPVLNATFSTQAVQCYNGNDGAIESAVMGGTPPYKYEWSNGVLDKDIHQLSTGTYQLTLSDSNQCIQQYSVTVQQPSDLTLSSQSTPANCFNGNDGMAAVSVSGGSGAYSYAWSDGSAGNAITNVAKGIYTVTITDGHGCTKTDSVLVGEAPELKGIFSSTAVRCFGGSDGNASVNISGGTPPYRYEWTPFGGNNEHASALASGNYFVNVHDDHGCMMTVPLTVGTPTALVASTTADSTHCFGGNDGAVHAMANGGTAPYTFFWNNGTASADAGHLGKGTYVIAVTDSNGCSTRDTVIVLEPTQVMASVAATDTICIGQHVTLNVQATGGTPGYTYNWTGGPATQTNIVSPHVTTNYSVIASDKYGCTSSLQSVIVHVNPPLTTTASVPDTICEGATVVLMGFCSGGNGGPYTYTWSNGQSGQSISVAPSVTSDYIVTATDACGTPSSTTSLRVNVNPNPHVNFTQSAVTGCMPLVVNFKDSSDLQGNQYYWSFGDGNSDSTNAPTHIYSEPGNYTVDYIVRTDKGCISRRTKSAAVKVYALPEADFSADPETASVFVPEIFFYDKSTNAIKWEWSYGDSSLLQFQRNSSHAFVDTGVYEVRLIATSNKGCVDTAYRKIMIKGEFAIYIPNAFSPNHDGVNDNFAPIGLGIKNYTMSIYNRWGAKIMDTSDLANGWDGINPVSEKNCPDDVYVFVMSVTDIQNKTHEYTGRVSLVR